MNNTVAIYQNPSWWLRPLWTAHVCRSVE